MEQFVIARRRGRYVKPISEPSRNLDAFSPEGSRSSGSLMGTSGGEVVRKEGESAEVAMLVGH